MEQGRFRDLCASGDIRSVVGDADPTGWAVSRYGGFLIDGKFFTTPDRAPYFRAVLEGVQAPSGWLH